MLLNALKLERECGSGRIRIEPFARELLKPSSYIARLGPDSTRWGIPRWADRFVDRGRGGGRLRNETMTDAFVLHPNEFVLGATPEAISLPSAFAGLRFNLSHRTRFGVSIHQVTAWASPCFGTHAPTKCTVELRSVNPPPVVRPEQICQLAFAPVQADSGSDLPLKYSVYDDTSARGRPRLYEEFGALLPRNRQ